MSTQYDVIVIGAGHNGLTLATRMAQAGRRVLVVEARDVVGGLAAAEEFHPGYRSAGVLHDTTGVRPHVVEKLGLERHGLRWRSAPRDVLALGKAGDALWIAGDETRAAHEIGQRSRHDAEAYGRYRAFLARIKPVLRDYLDSPALNPTDVESLRGWETLRRAWRVRRLGKHDMTELLRLPPMCVADAVAEWFRDDLLRAALALPAVTGSYSGPWSPGTCANLLFYEAAAGLGVEGGAPALVRALESALRAAGGEVRTAARVVRVLVDSGTVAGVVLENGEECAAPIVAASCDPRQLFLKLLPPTSFGSRLRHRMQHYRMRGTTAQVRFALERPPQFRATDVPVEFARTGAHVDEIERAFDAVKYRTYAERPVLELHVASVSDPTCAPEGHAVLSALVHFVPYDIELPWNDETRQRLVQRVTALVAEHAPGFADDVIATRVTTPHDLESEFGVTQGSLWHGEYGLDQRLVRPTPECADAATPIGGLFLCGSGSHPGGGLTGVPGQLGAERILAGS